MINEKSLNNDNRELSQIYKDALIGSGLVDGVDNLLALKPIVRVIHDKETLCVPGDPSDRLWIIVRGRLAVIDNESTVLIREKASVVGELGMIDGIGGRRAKLAAAHDDVEVIEILKRAIDAHPQSSIIWRNCASIVCRKLDEATHTASLIRKERLELQQLLRLYVGDHALSEGKLAPSSVLHMPRREIVVIWFSDIVGFSNLVAQMTPVRSAALVQKFLTPQVAAIDSRQGFIDKFIGDAVMAYWVVTTHDGQDECEEALDAAFETVSKINEIKLGPSSLQIRIGLHIGEVSIGNFGMQSRSQFTLIGNEVNIASRLENVKSSDLETGGPLGSIRVSDYFYRALGNNAKSKLTIPFSFKAKNVGVISAYTDESYQAPKDNTNANT